MRRRKIIVRVLLLLTLLQLIIFLFRDRFQYQPYTTEAQLYAPCDGNCINTWRQFADDYPANELKQTKAIANSVLGTLNPTVTKVMALGQFLQSRFYRQLGRPRPGLLAASPFQQYKNLSGSDTVQLWCGNFAQMFSFFCWSEGIACRSLEIMKEGDHHVLNECYLPETDQWIMVDLTHNLLAVMDSSGSFLNAAAFTRLLERGSKLEAWKAYPYSVRIERLDTGTAPGAVRSYYQSRYPVYYYHRTDNAKAYGTANKLKQYFLPLSWYDILTPERKTNALFYLKEALVLLWLLALLAFLSGRPKFGL